MYKHTQTNYTLVYGSAIALLLTVIVRVLEPTADVWPGIAAFCGLMLFGTLTITIGEGYIRWYFGPGLFRWKLKLQQVKSTLQVRNKASYGVGIRRFPKGKLYNVNGLDAVELVTVDGKIIRLGSDEAKVLKRAIDGKLA